MRRDKTKICIICKKEFSKNKNYSKLQWDKKKFCDKTCFGIYNRKLLIERFKNKENHPRWRGGIQKHGDGYVQIIDINHVSADSRGRVLEHRYVVEKYLGRKLSDKEIVHHINHDKLDNHIENLEILTRSEHLKRHPEIIEKGIPFRFGGKNA